MKITRVRTSGTIDNRSQLIQELEVVYNRLLNAIHNVEHHKQFPDHNLTLMWMDEVEYLSERAKEILVCLGEYDERQ